MCDNKSFQMIVQVRCDAVLTPNDRQCVGLCIQKICNVNRNRVVVQNCRMCSIDMKWPEIDKTFYWHPVDVEIFIQLISRFYLGEE